MTCIFFYFLMFYRSNMKVMHLICFDQNLCLMNYGIIHHILCICLCTTCVSTYIVRKFDSSLSHFMISYIKSSLQRCVCGMMRSEKFHALKTRKRSVQTSTVEYQGNYIHQIFELHDFRPNSQNIFQIMTILLMFINPTYKHFI